MCPYIQKTKQTHAWAPLGPAAGWSPQRQGTGCGSKVRTGWQRCTGRPTALAPPTTQLSPRHRWVTRLLPKEQTGFLAKNISPSILCNASISLKIKILPEILGLHQTFKLPCTNQAAKINHRQKQSHPLGANQHQVLFMVLDLQCPEMARGCQPLPHQGRTGRSTLAGERAEDDPSPVESVDPA